MPYKGPMYANSLYVGLKAVPYIGTLGAKVSTTLGAWAIGASVMTRI